jgi:hypothetical protein
MITAEMVAQSLVALHPTTEVAPLLPDTMQYRCSPVGDEGEEQFVGSRLDMVLDPP